MDIMERIPHVEGLDENMQGGIPRDICIICRCIWCHEIGVTFSMLYNAVLYGDEWNPSRSNKERIPCGRTCPTWVDVDDPVFEIGAIIDLDLRVQLDEQGMSNRVDWMEFN